jgi:glycosyltransferase involved in cell wall biosynthesis
MTVAPTIVVPCYNESARLDTAAFLHLGAEGGPALLFVNDGSRDDTEAVLDALAARAPTRIRRISLDQNRGKAEAVRQGVREALRAGADVVGYLDADLATPPAEVRRLLQLLADLPQVDVLLASRVSLLGRDIQRKPVRHYLGRVFASAASLLLGLRVYDTQCGAKLFRRTPQLEAALEEPFLSRWIFDVELLGRLLAGAPGVPPLSLDRIVEEPLRVWRDVAGSKIRPHHATTVSRDLVRIAADLRRRRSALGGAPR